MQLDNLIAFGIKLAISFSGSSCYERWIRNYYKGPYIKFVGGGGRRVFVGAMKYFRHLLMGHETFFKIFDGPRNIF